MPSVTFYLEIITCLFEEVPTANEVVVTRSKLGHSIKRLLECKFLQIQYEKCVGNQIFIKINSE